MTQRIKITESTDAKNARLADAERKEHSMNTEELGRVEDTAREAVYGVSPTNEAQFYAVKRMLELLRSYNPDLPMGPGMKATFLGLRALVEKVGQTAG